MFKRALDLTRIKNESLFLWGPRQSGKTTFLKQNYAAAYWIDLLKSEEFRRYTTEPELLRQELKPDTKTIVIDEIQKVPALLNEVHWLIENKKIKFILCGSSARKLRRGHANLLGGRALRKEMYGLVSHELNEQFDLIRMLNHGYLPRHYLEKQPRQMITSYVSDYLKEEIAAEGLVRNLPSFSNFLELAALSDTEIVNFTTFARDCGVSSPTVKEYFDILNDTMIGHWLHAYTKRPKRRTVAAPKFYFTDVGVVNFLAKRGRIAPKSELYGKAFENWVHHELKAYISYREDDLELKYWKLSSGFEVDFILGDVHTAIEAKATHKVNNMHLKGLRELNKDFSTIKNKVIVCLEPKPRKTEDNILILPYNEFCQRLWAGLNFKW